MISLLADIGGTNTRCALTTSEGRPGAVREFRNRDFDSLESLLLDYTGSLGAHERPDNGALAIAAPVRGDDVHMTNIDWRFSVDTVRNTLGLQELHALNDFEVLAWALPELRDDELVQVGGGRVLPGKPKGLIGPGTGLGVASLIPAGDGWIAVGGEGGHVTLPATNDREAAVIAGTRAEFGHCSAERLISGPGLRLLNNALHDGPDIDAAELSRLAIDGDARAGETYEVFFQLLGTVAANLALTIGAFGGIYVGGGITPRHRERFIASGFRDRFESKGRYGEYLGSIPTFLITSSHPTLLGLAAIAGGHAPPPGS